MYAHNAWFNDTYVNAYLQVTFSHDDIFCFTKMNDDKFIL